MLDQSNKGYISAEDMKNAMIKLGDPLTDKEIDAVMKEITNSDADKITFEDFKKAKFTKQRVSALINNHNLHLDDAFIYYGTKKLGVRLDQQQLGMQDWSSC